MTKKPKIQELTLKQRAWLKAYLDKDCPATFGNSTQSAMRAGYKCRGPFAYKCFTVVGRINYKKLNRFINKWLDENGLSETELMAKIVKGLDIKETKLFHHQGNIIESEPRDCIGEQRRYLDMAIKIKGLYKEDKTPIAINNLNIYAALPRETLIEITDKIVEKREAAKAIGEG